MSTADVLLDFFFFSSRRRHTRLVSDWSSDVCSSDLILLLQTVTGLSVNPIETDFLAERRRWIESDGTRNQRKPKVALPIGARGHAILLRSEERRVGKECRSRWSQ